MPDLDLDALTRLAEAMTYRGGDEQVLAEGTLALVERVRQAEAERDDMRASRDNAHEGQKNLMRQHREQRARAERAEAALSEVRAAYDATIHPEQHPDRCGACRIDRALSRYENGETQ